MLYLDPCTLNLTLITTQECAVSALTSLCEAHYCTNQELMKTVQGEDRVVVCVDCHYAMCILHYEYLLVLWCSCLATKVLISKYLATRRVVVSGGWVNGLDRQVPTSLLQHPYLYLRPTRLCFSWIPIKTVTHTYLQSLVYEVVVYVLPNIHCT